MNRIEFSLSCLCIMLFLALCYSSLFHTSEELNIITKYQHKIDSLKHTNKCYCTKLQFCDTLTEKEIDLAFKKSRGRVL